MLKYPPRLTLERNNAGTLFVGLDTYDQDTGMATSSSVITSTADNVVESTVISRFNRLLDIIPDVRVHIDY